MAAIRRAPTPPGPITELFDRLNDLHFRAGEPSVRQIARRIGTGVVSASTVYNALKGPRVPKLSLLKLIVDQLGGPVEDFEELWRAARDAERELQESALRVGPLVPIPLLSRSTSSHGRKEPEAQVPGTLPQPPDPPPPGERGLWGPVVPPRNPHFTARHQEMDELLTRFRANGSGSDGLFVQVLYGPGGIGKTEIALEYAHRYRGLYDTVWWIRAEQEDLIRDALIELGRHLELHDVRGSDSDRLIESTLTALSTGLPYRRSLLIFDNAIRPEVISRYLPRGGAHVLITTQYPGWRGILRARTLNVEEFDLAEAVEFLRHRVPLLGPADRKEDDERRRAEATELASALKGLPLAVEHAAAYLNETEVTVGTYLERFRRLSTRSFIPDGEYSPTVAACCLLSQDALTPQALALLRTLAMISPEPVSGDLLVRPDLLEELPEELREVLSSSMRFRNAVRELARFSLVRFDGVRNETQIHRIVKAIVQAGLGLEGAGAEERHRRVVHVLLAGSDPGGPEREENDAVYEMSRPHLIPSGAITSDHAPVRALVINQVRRLHLRARYSEAASLAAFALQNWRRKLGPDHLQTLALATEHGVALQRLGNGEEALRLNRETMDRLRGEYGVENDVFLACARSFSTGLRALGQYREALEWDEQWLPLYVQVFGWDHFRTLDVLSDIAINLRCLGRYEEALTNDRRTYRERANTIGETHLRTLDSRFAVARDLRRLGRYEQALDELIQIYKAVEQRGEPWRLPTLMYSMDLGVALRRTGDRKEALDHLEAVFDRHLAMVGPSHRQSLGVATNLVNDRRLAGDLGAARELGESTVRRWTEVVGGDHPNTLAAVANLAVVLRLEGSPEEARKASGHARAKLCEIFGEEHPHCLTVSTNLASDLAACGAVGEAVEVGERALEMGCDVRGENHPFTLATAANLALDYRAAGETRRAAELHHRTLRLYREQMGARHTETREVERGVRVDLDVEPDYV